jgi:hypothetical protein
MINWLRQQIRHFIFPESEGNAINLGKARRGLKHSTLSVKENIGLEDQDHNPIRFNVYNASGGKIVETRIYNERTDRWDSSLHVIDSSENFGEAVGKIVFMELLKKG